MLPLYQALQIAQERGLDLVAVSPESIPPVCRLLDYGKYKYEQTKKDRKAKKGQRVGLLREVRLRPKIEEHDLLAKIKTIKKLLNEGNKVRLVVRFRGRERVYPEMGWKVLQRVTGDLKDVAAVNDRPVGNPRNVSLTLSPTSTRKSKEVMPNAKDQNS